MFHLIYYLVMSVYRPTVRASRKVLPVTASRVVGVVTATVLILLVLAAIVYALVFWLFPWIETQTAARDTVE